MNLKKFKLKVFRYSFNENIILDFQCKSKTYVWCTLKNHFDILIFGNKNFVKNKIHFSLNILLVLRHPPVFTSGWGRETLVIKVCLVFLLWRTFSCWVQTTNYRLLFHTRCDFCRVRWCNKTSEQIPIF